MQTFFKFRRLIIYFSSLRMDLFLFSVKFHCFLIVFIHFIWLWCKTYKKTHFFLLKIMFSFRTSQLNHVSSKVWFTTNHCSTKLLKLQPQIATLFALNSVPVRFRQESQIQATAEKLQLLINGGRQISKRLLISHFVAAASLPNWPVSNPADAFSSEFWNYGKAGSDHLQAVDSRYACCKMGCD